MNPNTPRQVFGTQRHVVLPVIHAETAEQCVRNARIARDSGSDGVFLINHSISADRILEAAAEVRKRFGKWWIRINCLDLEPVEVFSLSFTDFDPPQVKSLIQAVRRFGAE